MRTPKKIPRGIRNCNPLNIRIGNTWLGERPHPDETEFEQFVSMKYGIRAGFVILRRYIRRYKRDCISAIIKSWAPASENDTQAYIDRVCLLTKMDENEPIKFEDKEAMVKLVSAMIRIECGQPVDENLIRDSYNIA